jgi:hypothetical protein
MRMAAANQHQVFDYWGIRALHGFIIQTQLVVSIRNLVSWIKDPIRGKRIMEAFLEPEG